MRPRHAFALVMVQHLDPDHESLLQELLSKKAQVPIRVIEDGMTVVEGAVHIIPPGLSLTIDGYTLRLSDFDQPRGLRLPIDSFFESLAEQHGANAVGVVLSGTGSDGAKGMRSIKNAGGLCLVQDPRQSAYDGMPRSAIDSGGSDLILPAEDIIDVIGEFFDRHSDLGETLKGDEEFKLRVAKHLLYRTGHDFSNYKIATMERRIARRMSVLGIQRPNEYLQRLISDDKEGQRLFQDILEDNFTPVSRKQRIYKRDEAIARPLAMPIATVTSGRAATTPLRTAKVRDTAPAPEDYYRQVVLEHHAPAFAVIDRNRVLGYTSGRIARYLEIGPGVPDLDIIDMARGPLRGLLRRLLATASTARDETHSMEWTGEVGDDTMRLTLYARPLRENRQMIVFDERDVRPAEDSSPVKLTEDISTIDDLYLRTLEDELEEAQQTVRTTVEELETSNEELKSSNEEIMSMNEEMQSANEELTTVNDELRNKVLELDAALSDLRNFTDSTNIATLFLDKDMTIRSFSPEARTYFRVVDKDRNRHLSDIAGELPMAELMDLCERVREGGERIEHEMQTLDGSADVKVSVIPYITAEKEQRGLVVVLIPVTELRQYARDLEQVSISANRHLNEIEELYRVSPQPMALMGPDMTYIRANEGIATVNGKPLEDHIGRTIYEIVPNLSDQVVEPVRKVFRTGEPILNQEVAGFTAADPDRERQWEVDWYPIREGGEVTAVGVSVRDVTKHHEMEMELRRVMRELQHRVKNMLSNVIALINRARREEGDHRIILDTLVKRINALATTHNLLTTQNWHSVLFEDLLKPELIDVYGPDRITLRGPTVRLSAKAAVAFGMTIHELATNAAKYGALASPGGRLEVRWSRTDEGNGEMLVVRWTETGGDPDTEKPSDPGFGTQLIDSTIRASLLGTIDKHFADDGFRAVIEVPIAELQRFDERDSLA